MARHVLVTGAAGFIGSHLACALVSEGHAVRVVDNFSTGSIENLRPVLDRIQLLTGDLSDPGLALEACRDIECVFHHSALPSVPASIQDPFATQRSGETATLRLLDACVARKVRRVILAASASAYGDNETLPHAESMRPDPLNPYAASKLACEHYLSAFARCHGLDGVALRYFNVFGPGQPSDSSYSGVISMFLFRMLNGERPVIYGDGNQTRDFTYVDNVVHANMLAMNCPSQLHGRVFNVGCGERISVKDLLAELNAALGTQLEPTFAPVRPVDPRHSVADISLAREVLGYAPVVAFRDGIKRLVIGH